VLTASPRTKHRTRCMMRQYQMEANAWMTSAEKP